MPPRALALLLLCAAACGGHPAVDVTLPPGPEGPTGPAVRIGRVQDVRVFGDATLEGRAMSLAPGVENVPAVTSRIIGRRRSLSGIQQGNVFLAEGRSVAQLVAEATALGLSRAGYRIAAPDAAAPALELVVRRLWIRMNTFQLLSYDFHAEIHVQGPVAPFAQGAWVCGTVSVARAGPSAGVWPHTLQKGLEDYARNLTERLTTRRLPPHCGRLSAPDGTLPDPSARMPATRE